MDAKKILTAVLIVFVTVSVVAAVVNVAGGGAGGDDAADGDGESAPEKATVDIINRPDADIDVVYYFMTNYRCVTCNKIETFTKEVVTTGYADAIENEKLIFRMVNVEQPENAHFIEDYGLFTKSVVLVRYRDGNVTDWKNLERVWDLINDETAYKSYVNEEIEAFTEAG